MAKKQSDLTQLKTNRKSTRFNDLVCILSQHGWGLQNVTGSHHIYSKPGELPIMVVRPHGKQKYCYPMDVGKVIAALEAEEPAEEQ